MLPGSSLSSLDPITGFIEWAAFIVAVLSIVAASATIVLLMIKKIQLQQLKEQLQKETNAARTAEEAADRMKLGRVPRAEKNRAMADVKTRQTLRDSLGTLAAMKTQQFSGDKSRYGKRMLGLLAIGLVSFSLQFLMFYLQAS
ncbi:hypothetical protein [Paenarthrobacter sp. 2TAF44]|uniref:hypothetical protein n=1 Tax=Paenarthrobacter sp. 2TAF44 TaxID=3233018 RepID=UPI003F97777C